MTVSFLLATFVLAAPVPKAGTELKWKFAKGDSFYIKHEQKSKTVVTTPGGALQFTGGSLEFVLVYKLTVTDVGEKETAWELTVESCKCENKDDNDLAGRGVKVTFDAKQQVTKVSGVDDVLSVASGTMRYHLNEEAWKGMVNGLTQSAPGRALAVAEKWEAETESLAFKGVTHKKAVRGKVVEVKDGVAKLIAKVDHSWTGFFPDSAAGIHYDLKGKDGDTSVWFDMNTGRLVEWKESYTMDGTMKGGGKGGARDTVQIKRTTTVTVSDKAPKDE